MINKSPIKRPTKAGEVNEGVFAHHFFGKGKEAKGGKVTTIKVL